MRKALLTATAITLTLSFGAAISHAGAPEPKGVHCVVNGFEGSPGQLANMLPTGPGVGNVTNNTANTIPGQEANAVYSFCEIQNGQGGNKTTKSFNDRSYVHVGIAPASD